jgi:surface antigen
MSVDLNQGPQQDFAVIWPLELIQLSGVGTMSSHHKVLAVFVSGLMLGGAAQAQLLPTWESHIALTQEDMGMIRNTVTSQIHGKPVGTTASWANPASRNSGSIRLEKKLIRKGQQCEEIAYTVQSGPPVHSEHYHLVSCLQPDGTWKIA